METATAAATALAAEARSAGRRMVDMENELERDEFDGDREENEETGDIPVDSLPESLEQSLFHTVTCLTCPRAVV